MMVLYISFLLSGCETKREYVEGLYLPEGNVEKGNQAFIDLKCHRIAIR